MIKPFQLFLFLLAILAPVCAVNAQIREALDGTWMVDTIATEASMLHAPSFKDSNAVMILPHLALVFYQFEGDKITAGSLPHMGNLLRYRRAKGTGSATSQVFVEETKNDSVTVLVLNEKNISVAYPAVPETSLFVWKRVTVDLNKNSPSDYKPEFDAYVKMVENLSKAFHFHK